MDHIIEAEKRWQKALGSGNEENVAKLYHKDAVLWGTLSPVIRNTPELIREYFERFASLQDINVVFRESVIREYGEIAVSTGYYDFSWMDNGRKVTVPGRYTFVFKYEGDWLIIDHHSSVIPETPFDFSKFIDGI